MASTIDVISGGRLNLGIGAGWQESEYRAYGYMYPAAPVRLKQLAEAVSIIKAMWTEPYASFRGEYFQIADAINEPKPIQKPHPPIWIGGGGEKVTLGIGARYGSAVNFSGSPSDVAAKCAALKAHCRDAERDYGSLVKSLNLEPVIIRPTTEEAIAVAEELKPAAYESVDHWRTRTLIGSPEYCRDRLRQYQALGIDYFVLYFAKAAEDPSGMDLFAREVLPAFS